MAEGTSSEKLIKPPASKEQMLQFPDGHLAIKVTGEKGAKYDLNDESQKYNPVNGNEAIVGTASGNEYYIVHDQKAGTYVVNIGATRDQEKLVAAYRPPENADSDFPPLEFGKKWNIGAFETTEVSGLLLKHRAGEKGYAGATQVDVPDPFAEHKKLIAKYRPGEV
jgi:hypothetical protein